MSLGVKSFVIGCWCGSEAARHIKIIMNHFPVEYYLPVYNQNDFADHQFVILRRIHNRMSSIRWGWYPDIDEFPIIGKDVAQKIMSGKLDSINGVWFDRIGVDGNLSSIPPALILNGKFVPNDQLLEDIYPNGCRARDKMKVNRVPVYVGGKLPPLRNGHHWVKKSDRKKWVDVHHFRYQANIIQRLEERFKRTQIHHLFHQLDYLKENDGFKKKDLEFVGRVLGV